MDAFSAFMAENVEKLENKKVAISKRFKDDKGQPIEWEIKPLTCEENDDLQRRAMVQKKLPTGQTVRELDQVKYTALMLTESVVYPDLHNAKLQDSYGVKTPEALLKKMLYPREEALLASEVMGYNQIEDLGDKVDEAKN